MTYYTIKHTTVNNSTLNNIQNFLYNFRMSRFLSLKKKKPTEKAELNKGDDNTKDKDYGSITSLINNEVKKTEKFRKRKRNHKK